MFSALHVHTETYQLSPDPFFPMCDTEKDLKWGWFGLACETTKSVQFVHAAKHQYKVQSQMNWSCYL